MTSSYLFVFFFRVGLFLCSFIYKEDMPATKVEATDDQTVLEKISYASLGVYVFVTILKLFLIRTFKGEFNT